MPKAKPQDVPVTASLQQPELLSGFKDGVDYRITSWSGVAMVECVRCSQTKHHTTTFNTSYMAQHLRSHLQQDVETNTEAQMAHTQHEDELAVAKVPEKGKAENTVGDD